MPMHGTSGARRSVAEDARRSVAEDAHRALLHSHARLSSGAPLHAPGLALWLRRCSAAPLPQLGQRQSWAVLQCRQHEPEKPRSLEQNI